MISLSVVVPCYNEEAVLDETARRLVAVLEDLSAKRRVSNASAIYFVDDGSQDRTWETIEKLTKHHATIRGVKLSRNRGHQNALLAGLFNATGDVVITMDADLQHDPAAIEHMLDKHFRGADIVFAVRESRGKEPLFKRVSGDLYYRLLGLMGVEVLPNHADYRLMSRRSIEALREYGEVNLFLRGIIPQLGFPSAVVHYRQAERFAGESKYSLAKMLGLALNGITSFSAAPLRFITVLGFMISLLSLCIAGYAIGVRLLTDDAVPGWASTVVPLYFLGGVQLLCIGIIGEYLAKIYMETKQRPRYAVERMLGEPESDIGVTPVKFRIFEDRTG